MANEVQGSRVIDRVRNSHCERIYSSRTSRNAVNESFNSPRCFGHCTVQPKNYNKFGALQKWQDSTMLIKCYAIRNLIAAAKVTYRSNFHTNSCLNYKNEDLQREEKKEANILIAFVVILVSLVAWGYYMIDTEQYDTPSTEKS